MPEANQANPPPAGDPAKPVLLFDGDCGFCRRWIARWHRLTGDRIEYAASQKAGSRFPQIPREAFDRSVWLVEPGGRACGGAEAVFRSLALAGQKKWLLAAYEHVPGFAPLTDALYHQVAEHRGILDPIDLRLLPDPADARRSFRLSRSIFLRLLGVIYLVAFLSLHVQIDGLIGSRGIIPVAGALQVIRASSPDWSRAALFRHFPTLLWFGASDGALHGLTIGGAVLSGILILGFLPVPVLALLWLFYLSLVTAGDVFLGYQWDALLLEAGFLAIFLAPLGWRLDAAKRGPSRIALLLLRWLLFRLMFLSGLVKLASGDATWRGLTALRYHYETQPLPTWTSWYAHLAPNWFQAVSVVGVLFIELPVPLMFFMNRRKRFAAFVLTVFFQILILATGNYGFFNLLTITLCVLLLDDERWSQIVRGIPVLRERVRRIVAAVPTAGGVWPLWITLPLAVCIVPLSLVPAFGQIGRGDLVPRPLVHLWRIEEPFSSVNGYGLFASMTTTRPEIIIQGSDDGVHWRSYEFKWKPGDVHRRPRFCTPHMPRLDWQMWFAALDVEGTGRLDDWVYAFLDRLREGSPAVIHLLRENPFPDRPPRHLRLQIYEYRFTTYAERHRDGAWWTRDLAATVPVD